MILHSLRVKSLHGYALAKHITQASDELLQIEEGSLYPALKRLLKEGLLNRRQASPPRAAPRLSID